MSTNQSSPRRARLARRYAVVGSVLAVALLGVAVPASVQAAPTTFDLYAVTGTAALPGQSVTVWGYNSTNATVTAPGGPVLTVQAGTEVQIKLHNTLAAPTSLVIRGQRMATDLAGVAGLVGEKTYTFTPTEPGTFIYEAGPMNVAGGTQHQVAMGLYGALVVTPANGSAAYGSDGSAVVVASEIDPALNSSANPAAFDMRNFAPKYTLFNGKTYPSAPVLTSAAPGDDIVMRYVNAGISYHSMSVLGANQRIVADDGHTLTHPYSVVAQTVGPGQTIDAVVSVSPTATAGTLLSVFDANLQLRNKGRRPATLTTLTATPTAGGAIGFIQVSGTSAPADTVGPVASQLAGTATTITATINDTTTGGSNVAAAEYFVDTLGAAGTGTPMTLTPGPSPVTATATFGAPLSPGTHTIYVRGKDAANNWGIAASVVVTTDNQAPVVSALSLTPNPSNGSVAVAVHATASDVGKGGSNITSATYSVDGGAVVPMVVNNPTVTASVDATINPIVLGGLVEGTHNVTVSATDSAGNTSLASAPIVLMLDKTGPAMSWVTATPNPSNGAIGVNSTTLAVRVSASATDLVSNVVRAEGFIDTVGADGAGFLLLPMDGAWGSTTEGMSVDIPLATIAALGTGNHTIFVHAKDGSGNWGPTMSTTLLIDKTGPVTSGVTATPNPSNGAIGVNSTTPAVRVTASATDLASNVVRAEGFIDTVGADGTGLSLLPVDGTWNSTTEAMFLDIPLATIAALGDGPHTISVHSRDAAGNWGPFTSTTLVVDKVAPTISSVSLAPTTIAFGTASVALTVTASDVGVGVTGGQYWFDGTATPPASPTAFTGTTPTLNPAALAGGVHTVYVRVKDGAGNWSTVSNTILTVVQAGADSRTIGATGNATQTSNVNAASGVLVNDQPTGNASRTARLVLPPVRIAGTGTGTITLSCPAALGTGAVPPISLNTVCTNGAYRVTLNATGTNSAQRLASRRGTYQFTYEESLNGVTSQAIVTITVS